jgi:hypothetical protein
MGGRLLEAAAGAATPNTDRSQFAEHTVSSGGRSEAVM